MSVETGKVCCNCRHNIRSYDKKNNMIVCHCEVHSQYLSYMEVMEGSCRHWAKEKEVKVMEKRKFEYEKGLCENAIMSAYTRGLAEGLNEAWECAKKLRKMEQPELIRIFKDKEKKMRLMGACNVIFADLTAAEAISEIKKYEEKQNEKDLQVKAIVNGNCMMCGKELSGDKIFFCEECEKKELDNENKDNT